MYTYNLKLHVENTECPPQIQLTETDNVQNVVVEVEGVDLSNKTAQVYIQKPDGHMIYNNCIVSDNNITFKVTSQMTAANGIAPADIIIYNSNGEKLHTMRFSLYIFPKLEDDSAIESTDEFTALDEALKKAESVKDGKSAYEIAVDNGFVGTEQEWLASLKGERGEKGEPGEVSQVEFDTLKNYVLDMSPVVTVSSTVAATDVAAPFAAENIKVDITGAFDGVNIHHSNVLLSEKIVGLNVDYEAGTFTRLESAVGKNPGADFDEIYCYGGRKRCNVADDGTILAYYGDANFTEDGSNGQVMVYQPKFYYKVEPLKTEEQATGIGYHLRNANYYVADYQAEGFNLHPAFIDENGNEVDYVLMGAYEACIYDTSEQAYLTRDEQVMDVNVDKLSSIANVKPASGSTQQLTRPNVETLAQNRGSNWHGSTVKIASMNQLLCMIEMGTMNFQTAIGPGVVSYASGSGNEASNTGATSSLGNGTGQATQTTHISSDGTETIDTTSGKLSVSYRGLENPLGNIWEFEYGVNIWGNGNMAGGEPYVADDFNFAESKRTDNYEGAGFTVSNADGYISAMGYSTRCDWLFMASECVGNNALPVGDYTYIIANLNAYRISLLGGYWHNGASAGGFYWNLGSSVGYRYRDIGGRLVYVPSTTTSTYHKNDTVYSISWRTQAGTINSGTLDVTTGVLTFGSNTYNLTPTEITMFRGINSLWADTGDITLTYRQDVALLLEKLGKE